MKWFSPDIEFVPDVNEFEKLINEINDIKSTYPFSVTDGTNYNTLQCFDVSKFNFYFNSAKAIRDKNNKFILFINVQDTSNGFLVLPLGKLIYIFGVVWSEESPNFYNLSFNNDVLRKFLAGGVLADYPWPNPTEVVYVNPFARLEIQDKKIVLNKTSDNKVRFNTNNFSGQSIKILGDAITAKSVKGGS